MNREVMFADGTAFPCEMCGASSGVLWIVLDVDKTILEVVEFLSHPTNTEAIKCYSVGFEESAQVYEGHTHLMMVQEMANGWQVALRKEAEA